MRARKQRAGQCCARTAEEDAIRRREMSLKGGRWGVPMGTRSAPLDPPDMSMDASNFYFLRFGNKNCTFREEQVKIDPLAR